jgi:hypothetical protein
MKSLDFGQFLVTRVTNQKKEEEKFLAELREYPDLKVFADCANLLNQFDLVIARP